MTAKTKIKLVLLFLFALTFNAELSAQSRSDSEPTVLWEKVSISAQDLYEMPDGGDMKPDLSRITFVSVEKGGHSLKYKIKDGSGQKWVAKIGDEAQSETASVRLLSALGYKTETVYLIPRLTIPTKGTYSNVRLEARPENVDRGKNWRWGQTPFEGTRQMQGLKLMMAFLNNWDMKELNNVILKRNGQQQYVISDLGVSFGKPGKIRLPLFWVIGRSRNNPDHYSKSKFVKETDKGMVKLAYYGKHRGMMKNFTVADARWLADLLTQLSDKQIRDAFRAANYSAADINTLTRAVKDRISQLDRAASPRSAGK